MPSYQIQGQIGALTAPEIEHLSDALLDAAIRKDGAAAVAILVKLSTEDQTTVYNATIMKGADATFMQDVQVAAIEAAKLTDTEKAGGTTSKKGLTTLAKVGIAIGGVLLVGGIAFAVAHSRKGRGTAGIGGMGKRSDPLREFVGKVRLERVRLNGDYESDGTYWGGGRGSQPLYVATDDEGHEHYLRANNRFDAKEQIKSGGITKFFR